MKTYADLNLKKLRDECGLDFAHYTYQRRIRQLVDGYVVCIPDTNSTCIIIFTREGWEQRRHEKAEFTPLFFPG